MLRIALLGNIVFSSFSALIIGLMRNWLSHQIPLPPILFLILSGGLILFATLMLWVQQTTERQVNQALSIIVSDCVWVFSTLTLAILFSRQLSNVGWTLIIGVNCVVASLAYLQFIGLKELRE